MKVKSESEVAQSCPTLSDPMDYSLPGSSVRGIFQARVLDWGAIAFSHLKGGFILLCSFTLNIYVFFFFQIALVVDALPSVNVLKFLFDLKIEQITEKKKSKR